MPEVIGSNLTEGKKYFSAILMHTVQNTVLYIYAKQRYEHGCKLKFLIIVIKMKNSLDRSTVSKILKNFQVTLLQQTDYFSRFYHPNSL